jgi:hypothetical protein
MESKEEKNLNENMSCAYQCTVSLNKMTSDRLVTAIITEINTRNNMPKNGKAAPAFNLFRLQTLPQAGIIKASF